ncbi:MAG: hypothetical protein BWY99_00354 [Synergistetes bacterium ADurb.BinA166]|nr:MAG: hypothetical protein BWY99_00354 [Synergistetes bacterium ADurb.BinA166]
MSEPPRAVTEVVIETTPEAAERILEAFRSGRLQEILGDLKILDVQAVEPEDVG